MMMSYPFWHLFKQLKLCSSERRILEGGCSVVSIGCSAVSVGPADEDGQEADFEEVIDLTCSNEDAFDDSSV